MAWINTSSLYGFSLYGLTTYFAAAVAQLAVFVLWGPGAKPYLRARSHWSHSNLYYLPTFLSGNKRWRAEFQTAWFGARHDPSPWDPAEKEGEYPIQYPASRAELAALVGRGPVRIVGSGYTYERDHSNDRQNYYTGMRDDGRTSLVSLRDYVPESLGGRIGVDTAAQTATCSAGVTLRELLAVLHEQGWTLAASTFSCEETIGGILVADSHGTSSGETHACLSDLLASVVCILPDGSSIVETTDVADIIGYNGVRHGVVAATLNITELAMMRRETTYVTMDEAVRELADPEPAKACRRYTIDSLGGHASGVRVDTYAPAAAAAADTPAPGLLGRAALALPVLARSFLENLPTAIHPVINRIPVPPAWHRDDSPYVAPGPLVFVDPVPPRWHTAFEFSCLPSRLEDILACLTDKDHLGHLVYTLDICTIHRHGGIGVQLCTEGRLKVLTVTVRLSPQFNIDGRTHSVFTSLVHRLNTLDEPIRFHPGMYVFTEAARHANLHLPKRTPFEAPMYNKDDSMAMFSSAAAWPFVNFVIDGVDTSLSISDFIDYRMRDQDEIDAQQACIHALDGPTYVEQRYIVVRDAYITITVEGKTYTVLLPQGYLSDGISGVTTRFNLPPSDWGFLIHDILFTINGKAFTRSVVNEIFFTIMGPPMFRSLVKIIFILGDSVQKKMWDTSQDESVYRFCLHPRTYIQLVDNTTSLYCTLCGITLSSDGDGGNLYTEQRSVETEQYFAKVRTFSWDADTESLSIDASTHEMSVLDNADNVTSIQA